MRRIQKSRSKKNRHSRQQSTISRARSGHGLQTRPRTILLIADRIQRLQLAHRHGMDRFPTMVRYATAAEGRRCSAGHGMDRFPTMVTHGQLFADHVTGSVLMISTSNSSQGETFCRSTKFAKKNHESINMCQNHNASYLNCIHSTLMKVVLRVCRLSICGRILITGGSQPVE